MDLNKALELLRAEYTKMNKDMIEDVDRLKQGRFKKLGGKNEDKAHP